MARRNPFNVEADRSTDGPTVFLLADDEKQAARRAIAEVRADAGQDLPQLDPRAQVSVQIAPDKIGALFGDDGETVRDLEKTYDADIAVDGHGMVTIAAATLELGETLADRIRSMTQDVEVGATFTGTVAKTTTFGAFVELTNGQTGLLHISAVAPGQRASTVEDYLNKGDEIAVRVVEVDHERGRIGLRLADDPAVYGKSTDDLTAASLDRHRRAFRRRN